MSRLSLLQPDRYRVTAWILGAIALVAPVIALTQFEADIEPDMLAFALWLAVPNALAGFVLSWRWADMPDPLTSIRSSRYRRYAANVDKGLIDAVIVLAIQFLGTTVIQLVVAISGNDWDEFFVGPLLITACAGMALFLAILIGLLVVAPLRMLGGALVTLISGGRVDSARPAFAFLLLLLIPLSVLSLLAGYAAPNTSGLGMGGKGVVGIFYLARVLFTIQGTAEQQVFAWIARLLVVLMALCLVWLARIARRRRAS